MGHGPMAMAMAIDPNLVPISGKRERGTSLYKKEKDMYIGEEDKHSYHN